MYADDLLLLSASALDLQRMLNVCERISLNLELKFNCSKSKCLFIGPDKNLHVEPMQLNGANLEWAESIKYLGVSISSATRFTVDFSETRRKFFIAVNSIISKCKYSTEIVKLHLMEMHCLPILLYAIESLKLPHEQIMLLNSWWNSVYRKLFNYNKWESVKEVIYMLERLDLVHLIALRRARFIKRFLYESDTHSTPSVFTNLFVCNEVFELERKYKIDISWTESRLKGRLMEAFHESAL